MNIEIFDINNGSVDEPTIKYQELTFFHRKLSHLLKTAKFKTLKLLKMKYKKFELKVNKKGEDCKEKSKLKHKSDEIEFLNQSDLDHLAKCVFANKYSEEDMDKQGDKMSIEDRIVIRLFHFDLVKTEINTFRSKHPDWERLAEDLFYKNTGGRIKINKSKKSTTKPVVNSVTEKKTDLKQEEKPESILLIPALEEEKRKKELTKKRDAKIKVVKEIEKQKEIEEKLQQESKCLQLSEEAICEFIKNEDDLDEWEKNLNDNEDKEIDLMSPLDGSEKTAPKKKRRGGKKINLNREQNRQPGEKWKGTRNSFGTKKAKISDE